MTYRAALDEFARELHALTLMRASWRFAEVRVPNPVSIRIPVPLHSHPPHTARLTAAIPVGTGEGTGSSVIEVFSPVPFLVLMVPLTDWRKRARLPCVPPTGS